MSEGLSSHLKRLMRELYDEFRGEGAAGSSRDYDFAALKVAMAVAALDGDVTAAELSEFEQLIGSCAIPEGEARAEAFDACLRFAGYLSLQARRLSKEELLETFVREALDALPAKFFRGDMSHVRRAFAMWTAIAMSDDFYAGIERQAIGRLREGIAGAVESADLGAASLTSPVPYSAVHGAVPPQPAPVPRQAPTAEFLSKLEGVISRLKHEATARQAAIDLENLING